MQIRPNLRMKVNKSKVDNILSSLKTKTIYF